MRRRSLFIFWTWSFSKESQETEVESIVATFSVSSFSDFFESLHILVSPSDVISLAVFDVRPPRKPIYLFFLEFICSVWCICILSVAHDKILGHIAIYNDYKFAAYPYSTLQKFIVDNEVIITIHFEMFSLGTMRKLYTRQTCFYIILRRIVSITHELISHGILVSVRFLLGKIQLFLMHVHL